MPFTDSDPEEGGLNLLGVWIHDPLDPEGTVRQYIYGAAARSTQIGVAAEGLVFAGRTYPVFEYGEHQEDAFSVKIDVPHGSDWATNVADLESFAQARRTLYLRDNRGRAAYGHLSGYQESDQNWGTQVSFTFTRVDFEVEV